MAQDRGGGECGFSWWVTDPGRLLPGSAFLHRANYKSPLHNWALTHSTCVTLIMSQLDKAMLIMDLYVFAGLTCIGA